MEIIGKGFLITVDSSHLGQSMYPTFSVALVASTVAHRCVPCCWAGDRHQDSGEHVVWQKCTVRFIVSVGQFSVTFGDLRWTTLLHRLLAGALLVRTVQAGHKSSF